VQKKFSEKKSNPPPLYITPGIVEMVETPEGLIFKGSWGGGGNVSMSFMETPYALIFKGSRGGGGFEAHGNTAILEK
jgi:hypothetical protein